MSTTRRIFLMALSTSTAGISLGARAQALVNEKDAQAAALGYVADATKTDTKKFPKYAAGQVCTNCALYQGKPADTAGGCPLFAGKQVAGKGWCSAWAKKG
ncbi:MAG: high-potential iron-sulfur protein [Burkholderiaceae bacterium]